MEETEIRDYLQRQIVDILTVAIDGTPKDY
jgi:hypothetical protein